MKPSKDTRARILDVAEELFSEKGFDRVSIRDITTQADVNLAAINYHFGSKEDLIAAVFERRVVPVNEARIAALDEVQRKKKPKLEEVLEAFIRPTIQSSPGAVQSERIFSRLFGRVLSDPSPEIENLLKQQFEPLTARFYPAILDALPQLSRSEVFWRLKFTFGALHHWHLTKDRFLPPWLETVDIDSQIQKLISFVAAGFRSV